MCTISKRAAALMAAALFAMPGAWAASKHDHGGGPGAASLLPACQGAAALPSPDCGQVPTPAIAPDGRLWLAFVQHGHVYVTASQDLGATFPPPRVVNPVPETIYSDGENRPKVALGTEGELYVSWTRKIEGRYAGDIRFARSLDGGEQFDAPLTVNDDHAPISHRFDAMAVDGQGRVYVAWIDKRDLTAAKAAGSAYSGAAIYYALSEDHGASFAFNRKVVDHSCECCRVAMASTGDDGVVALWRHVYPENLRDHAIAILSPTTSPIAGMPVRATDDGWKVEGCPHHGPDLALGPGGRVHLTWFTLGTKHRGLMYGRFNLATGTMEVQHPLDEASGAGRPQVLAAGGRLYAAWKSFDGKETDLLLKISQDDGESWSPPRVLAHTADGSDYPILVSHGEEVYLSWQTRAEGYRLIPVTNPAPGVSR